MISLIERKCCQRPDIEHYRKYTYLYIVLRVMSPVSGVIAWYGRSLLWLWPS